MPGPHPLTEIGRQLLARFDKEIGPLLIKATGLGDDFPKVQEEVVELRDNLLRSLSDPTRHGRS